MKTWLIAIACLLPVGVVALSFTGVIDGEIYNTEHFGGIGTMVRVGDYEAWLDTEGFFVTEHVAWRGGPLGRVSILSVEWGTAPPPAPLAPPAPPAP